MPHHPVDRGLGFPHAHLLAQQHEAEVEGQKYFLVDVAAIAASVVQDQQNDDERILPPSWQPVVPCAQRRQEVRFTSFFSLSASRTNGRLSWPKLCPLRSFERIRRASRGPSLLRGSDKHVARHNSFYGHLSVHVTFFVDRIVEKRVRVHYGDRRRL